MSGGCGILLSDDLLFASQVTAAARTHGLALHRARNPQELLALARQHRPAAVLIDLDHPELDLPALVAELRGVCPAVRLVGYGSHVHVERLQAARRAGCEPVWPRSRFVAELASALPGWFGRPHAPSPEISPQPPEAANA